MAHIWQDVYVYIQETNKTQTRHKQDTNKRQTRDKQETNRRQTGDKKREIRETTLGNKEKTTGYFEVPQNWLTPTNSASGSPSRKFSAHLRASAVVLLVGAFIFAIAWITGDSLNSCRNFFRSWCPTGVYRTADGQWTPLDATPSTLFQGLEPILAEDLLRIV